MRRTLALALASAAAVYAQTTTTAAVPTTAIQGDYTGRYRPQAHFSPPKGFMNDPNGLHVDSNGTWHLYYQYNPSDVVAGFQHWGHATSTDLYHWTNQPIALFPPNASSGVFSGSAVVDRNNTSGFFPNTTDGVVAVYTLHTDDYEVQNVAYSLDGGYSFTEYENNPVINVNSDQFRDPKIVWYQDHWVMAVAYPTEFVVGFYTSPDLKTWTHSSNFTHHGLLGLLYECPNLVEIPVLENGVATGENVWTLFISVNPGSPQGGSSAEYFPGTFDGYTFTPVDGAYRAVDFAKDNYAEQWFWGTKPDEAVSIAWASNWQYTNVVPTGDEGWRSAMTLPRKSFLTQRERTGWEFVSIPYGLETVVGSQLKSQGGLINDSVSIDYSSVSSGAVYFELNVTIPDSIVDDDLVATTVNFTFTSSAGDKLKAGYFYGGTNLGVAWIDRRNTKGFGDDNPFFTDRFSTAALERAKTFSGVIDRTVFEMFVDQGALSGTSIFFPEDSMNSLTVATGGFPDGSDVQLGVWEIRGTW